MERHTNPAHYSPLGYTGMKRSLFIHPKKPRQALPWGFTMLELLVVIGIIIFLMGILITVVSGALTSAREAATKTTIKKIDGLLAQRMQAFNTAMEALNKSKVSPITSPKPSPGKPVPRRVNPISLPLHLSISGWVFAPRKDTGSKSDVSLGFPQTLNEILATSGPNSLTAPNVPTTYIPANNNPITESSEALYWFLTSAKSFGQAAVDEDAFTSSEVADTDGDGLKEFIDGWGRPLRFYRWPTRLIRPANPANTQQTWNKTNGTYGIPVVGNNPSLPVYSYFGKTGYDAGYFFGSLPGSSDQIKDPDDPLLVLLGATWTYSDGTNKQQMTPAIFEAGVAQGGYGLHTPETWSLPLIVSAGKDDVLGLYEPYDTANYGHLAQPDSTTLDGMLDDISNRRLAP